MIRPWLPESKLYTELNIPCEEGQRLLTYSWADSETVAFCIGSDTSCNWSALSIRSGDTLRLPFLNRITHGNYMSPNGIVFSGVGRNVAWIENANITNSNHCAAICTGKIDGREIQRTDAPPEAGDIVWSADGTSLLAIEISLSTPYGKPESGVIHRCRQISKNLHSLGPQFKMRKSFSGFSSVQQLKDPLSDGDARAWNSLNNTLVEGSAHNGISRNTGSHISCCIYRFSPEQPIQLSHDLPVPTNSGIISVSPSPDCTLIALAKVVDREDTFPFMSASLSRKLGFVHREKHLDLWMVDIDGTRRSNTIEIPLPKVGISPDGIASPHPLNVKWIPGSRRLSFVVNDRMYLTGEFQVTSGNSVAENTFKRSWN